MKWDDALQQRGVEALVALVLANTDREVKVLLLMPGAQLWQRAEHDLLSHLNLTKGCPTSATAQETQLRFCCNSFFLYNIYKEAMIRMRGEWHAKNLHLYLP